MQEILNGDGVSVEEVKKELVKLRDRSKVISGDVKGAGTLLKLITERSNTNYFWIIIVGIYLLVAAFQ